jgi:glutaredoxin
MLETICDIMTDAYKRILNVWNITGQRKLQIIKINYNKDNKMITVYSKKHCPFCDQAKALLKLKGIEFEEIKIDESSEAREFIVGEGHRTVPQIYQDGKLLVEGGFQGLAKQDQTFWEKLK